MEIVGFSGYARAGKDEAAKALLGLGFVRVSFADKLRDFLYRLNPVVEYIDPFQSRPVATKRLQDIILAWGWDGYKDTKWSDDIRRQLQILGTECGRNIIGDNVWVDALFNGLNENGKYVIADVRFFNEAEGIRERSGKIYRIMREGVGPANNHSSETALDDYSFDNFIHNDGSLEHFHDSVRRRILENRS